MDPAESARISSMAQETLAGLDTQTLSQLFKPGAKGALDWDNAKGTLVRLGVPEYDANGVAFYLSDFARDNKHFWNLTTPESFARFNGSVDDAYDTRRKMLMYKATEYFGEQLPRPDESRQRQLMQLGR